MSIQHELRIRVRYAETDQMGVVHHAAYLVYLEEGRTELMREIGIAYDQVERSGFAMGVRRVNVRYRMSARYGDVILCRTQVVTLRGASIVYGYELVRESSGDLLLTGTVETVSLELGSMRPAPLPASIRDAIATQVGVSSATGSSPASP